SEINALNKKVEHLETELELFKNSVSEKGGERVANKKRKKRGSYPEMNSTEDGKGTEARNSQAKKKRKKNI
ncbi:719_t:CDS:2, partial [Racocetra persica]